MKEISLARGEISLRPLRKEDAPLLLKWMRDPAVLEWYEGRDQIFTPERIREDFFTEEPGMHRCAVEYRARPVGYVQIYPLSPEGMEEYGYSHPEHRAFALDQFIGELDCWNQKIGRTFLSLLQNIWYGRNMPRQSCWTLTQTTCGPFGVTKPAAFGK